MSDKKIELNRRRVLGGLITVGGAAAAAGAGTFALFSDTETSSGNTIQAGTLSLDAASSTQFPFTNIVPGWSATPSITTDYNSNSSIDPVSVDLTLSLSENDAANDPASTAPLSAAEFGQKIRVNSATIDDGTNTTDLTTGPSPRTTGHPGSQSYIDLDQLADGSTVNGVLTDVSPGDTITLSLDLEMPTAVGNSAQADGVDLTAEFVAEQP